MILSPSDAAIAQAAQALRDGQLAGLPTETVYGLAANAGDDAAVAKIFVAKGRPADHPLIVHVAAFDGGMGGVAHYCAKVPAFAQQLMSAFWPGPLTLILKRQPHVIDAVTGGQSVTRQQQPRLRIRRAATPSTPGRTLNSPLSNHPVLARRAASRRLRWRRAFRLRGPR